MSQGDLKCIGEEVVDNNLTLLLVKGSGMPRLGIFNTKTNKKKYVCFSWLEGDNKSLKIKISSAKTQEYPKEVLMKGVFDLIKNNEDLISLNTLMWRGVQMINDLLHMPKSARTEGDANLIVDSKRDALWFAYTPRDDDWRVRPCFVTTPSEAQILENHLQDGIPWRGLPIDAGVLPVTMRNMPVPRELFNINPDRWSGHLPFLSKCMLLGFSDWSPDGEHLFSEALWSGLAKSDYRSEDSLIALASAGRQFVTSVASFLRLWPVCQKISFESVPDSLKTTEERGYKKKDRYQVVAAHLGDKRFSITRYADAEDRVIFGIVPETRLPGEQDRMFAVDSSDWDACVDACSLGGERDPQHTCVTLMRGLETKDWYADIVACVSEG